MPPLKAFLCHSSHDASFVIEVGTHLQRNLDGIYYYEEYQRADQSFVTTISRELEECNVTVIFIGNPKLSKYQRDEAQTAYQLSNDQRHILFVLLPGQDTLPKELAIMSGFPIIKAADLSAGEAYRVAKEIADRLHIEWVPQDGLPYNRRLFEYEKDIIEFFSAKPRLEELILSMQQALAELEPGSEEFKTLEQRLQATQMEYEHVVHDKYIGGCPTEWPQVVRWSDEREPHDNELPESEVGNFRPDEARVVAAALSRYHDSNCIMQQNLCFPEAGPRKRLFYPLNGSASLNVAVLVSGGIAPGINAVIDGITQRHFLYAEQHHYTVNVYGLKNGLQAFDNYPDSRWTLLPEPGKVRGNTHNPLETHSHVSEGGSILGTSRYAEFLDPVPTHSIRMLDDIVSKLYSNNIDILYIIGGDGGMKAAHAIWSYAQEYAAQHRRRRKLSVVGIPKTIHNDILWVWQTFGFLSAVERAREVIEDLALEVQSNPRLGIVQLFSSESGFVVSHAVLASRTGVCDVALIPEITFSLEGLARYLKQRMCQRRQQAPQNSTPYGFVVMAETAIPVDAIKYIDRPEIDLNESEKQALHEFLDGCSQEDIESRAGNALRSASLKIVSNGLPPLLRSTPLHDPTLQEPDWDELQVLTHQPGHLLRAVHPHTIDIITAQRLGMLAVDNALAGYTDFMVSQWLTEYVLVPLQLVVLGKKRIPKEGIFWKSVLAKTKQPFDLV